MKSWTKKILTVVAAEITWGSNMIHCLGEHLIIELTFDHCFTAGCKMAGQVINIKIL